MRNCHHFPLSLQFLYHSLSDLHNRTHLNRRRNQHCPSLGDRNTVAVPVGDRKLSGSGYKDGERVAVGEFHLYFAIDINKVGVEIGTLNQRSRAPGAALMFTGRRYVVASYYIASCALSRCSSRRLPAASLRL